MLTRRIEEVSLNSWPALRQILFDGWIVRFSKGYTKRANSVNPLFDSSMDVDEKVDVCEALYAARGLPTVFRLTHFSSPPEIDRVLESRNYQIVAPTLVLYLGLEGHDVQPAAAAELRDERLDDWIELFCRFHGSAVGEHQAHREILEAIPSRRFLATLVDGGQPVACALGVMENGYFGLFDLVTDPQQRNRGYGTRFVSGLLRWAQEHGALHAYLQVVARNAPARHLYAKFGFQEAYQYWYRVAGA